MIKNLSLIVIIILFGISCNKKDEVDDLKKENTIDNIFFLEGDWVWTGVKYQGSNFPNDTTFIDTLTEHVYIIDSMMIEFLGIKFAVASIENNRIKFHDRAGSDYNISFAYINGKCYYHYHKDNKGGVDIQTISN